MSSRSPLPPNRTSGSPEYGSPVDGFTSLRIDEPSRRRCSGCTAHAWQRRSSAINQAEPFSSFHSVFQGCQHAIGPDPRFGPRPSVANRSGLFSQRHFHRVAFHAPDPFASTFLRPFAPRALPRFFARMDALTSAGVVGDPGLRRSVRSCRSRRGPQAGPLAVWPRPVCHLFPSANALIPDSSPCLPRSTFRSFRPQSLSHLSSDIAFARYLSRVRLLRLSPGQTWTGRWDRRRTVRGSPSAWRLPGRFGRIGFVILRTDLSPPVALHPVSRRRSYFRLQACNVHLVGTCTPLIERFHRRTCRRLARRIVTVSAT